MPSNEEILRQVVQVDARLSSHIMVEEPILLKAKELLDIHGDSADMRARIAFVEAWMEREKDYAKLRRAIIEKTIVGAVWAVTIYLLVLIQQDLVAIVRGWTGRS